jgi:hypothetical protein
MHPYPAESIVTVKEADASAKEADVDWETRLRIQRDSMSWGDWVRYDFLRYCYWLLTLAIVAFELLQISWMYHVRDALGLSALAVGGFVQIAVIFYVYKFIWPEGAFTEGWPAGARMRRGLRRLKWKLRWRL